MERCPAPPQHVPDHAAAGLAMIYNQRERAMQDFIKTHPDIIGYVDYDKLLEHELDAVVLANYGTEHAPTAIQALRAGLHVQSENIAIRIMGEAVELLRAAPETGRIYKYTKNCV